MAVNGRHAGTKQGPNWGHVINADTAAGELISVYFDSV